MNINKDSWHYRLLMEFGGSAPSNLCPYVRKVISALVAFGMMFFLGACLTAFIGLGLGSIAGYIVTGILLPSAVMSLVILALVLIAAHFLAMGNHGSYRDFILYPFRKVSSGVMENKGTKEPRIFVEYIKAKHNKLCPTLDFSGEYK